MWKTETNLFFFVIKFRWTKNHKWNRPQIFQSEVLLCTTLKRLFLLECFVKIKPNLLVTKKKNNKQQTIELSTKSKCRWDGEEKKPQQNLLLCYDNTNALRRPQQTETLCKYLTYIFCLLLLVFISLFRCGVFLLYRYSLKSNP